MEGSQPRLSEASSWRDRGRAAGVDMGGASGRDDDVAIPSALASPRTETQSCT